MFGVEMHTGKRVSNTGKFCKSKTEAVFFPRRSFWHQETLSAGVAEEDAATIVSETDNEPGIQRERRQNTKQAICAAHSNTHLIVPIPTHNRLFSKVTTKTSRSLSASPTLDVTYLGRIFSGNLRDFEATRTRIAKANAAFTCLVKFFKRKEIKLDCKTKIFKGICVKTSSSGAASHGL
ncbi:hypothetical protein THAOC_07420 [Thalassiosira oceanica]|uniref:Uncharacterized protein n=1 Tax=Thalassiosira oceanica TaxID=159749 RepID=K0TKI6_THAOC|nr:hypothetical protein THAOC_07420 [Thalassiosira oceanica]|eukprot:EJK71167.1 hypothetical protein THAOC_07420 [Thalassiosira oceanica]